MLSFACSSRFTLCGLFAAVLGHLCAAAPASAGADLYIKDTPVDTGSEPNLDTGPMWVSEDVWVRTTPDPGYQPYPFPEASPTWIPLPNESPEYRDPKFSVPNYVYVRVRNRGDAPSTGTERLRVYWAKASTGLGWPVQWVDYLATDCGPSKLYGAELTKPRQNAATATAAERDAYRDAILKVGTLPGFVFPGGIRYWHKQDQVHQNAMSFFPSPHGGLAFTPWHREMINRYEILLQEADPTVKLLYWDWTKDPGSTTGFNFFTPPFMGASGRGTGGVSIGAPFLPALAPPAVSRKLSTSTTPPANPDTTVLAAGGYPTFRSVIENVPNHNSSHTYIGGNMAVPGTATEDPFFFLLHANNDRLWAQWQRNPTQLARRDQAQTYGTATTHADIVTSIAPWNGTGPAIQPWTAADGYIVGKSARHPSVVFPPIYDTAPLTIPVLLPGEAVVIEIPWYPLNPADFACFGGDQGHACLLARIETAVASPFGMTTPEIASVNANTNANNNIAWKNVTVVDNFTGSFKTASVLVRNPSPQRVQTTLQFATPEEFGASFLDFGQVQIDLGALLPRWDEGGGQGRGIRNIGGGNLLLTSPNAFLSNLRIEPGETFPVHLTFRLSQDYQPPRGVFPKLDVIQLGLPGNNQAVVGGQRFEMDFDRLALVPEDAEWRFFDRGRRPGVAWASPEFDDRTWKVGRPGLGFGGERPAPVTTYFRRRFEVGDQRFFRSLELRLKRDDGAAVYLNGIEVVRANLPGGALSPQTLATRKVEGLEEELVFAVPLQGGLRDGTNVLAVEVHQAAAGDTDLSFDLALIANDAFPGEPPGVAFAPGLDGRRFQVGQAIALPVEGLDSDGTVAAVSFFADGRLLGTVSQPPFRFVWRRAPRGSHRLRAVATDGDGQQSTAEASISVLANLPPTVQLTAPASGHMMQAGTVLTVAAAAADPGGAVVRVQYYLRKGVAFDVPTRLVGTVTRAPYRLVLRGLQPDHYMLTAVAVDAQGATGESSPIHFMVHP